MTDRYIKTNWYESYTNHHSNWIKRTIYYFLRPLISLYCKRYINSRSFEDIPISSILFERGLPVETRRIWGSKRCNIKNATILVQGTGTGWDAVSWAALKPRKIICTDKFDFSESWGEIVDYCREKFNLDMEFRQAELENHYKDADIIQAKD